LTFTDRLNPDKKIQLRAEPFPIKILSKENHSLHVLLSLNYFELPLDNEKRYIVAFGTDINIFDLREYLDSAYSDKKVSIQKSLSPREICVLKLISKGRKDKEIAEILKISIHTAKTHRKNIIHKMGQTNSGSLINYAIENRLV
jgi:DNA-binding CsgD family transcriptional regulator